MIKGRLAKQNSESRRKRKLTSSKEGVEELPATIAWLSPAPVLALFSEGAWGLAIGVDVSTFC
jgi:hypothetical protein